MTPIARGQAIEMSLWSPSPVIHACWKGDAVQRIYSGYGNVVEKHMVVLACGTWVTREGVHETAAPVDCMTCLVYQVKYDRGPDEAGHEDRLR